METTSSIGGQHGPSFRPHSPECCGSEWVFHRGTIKPDLVLPTGGDPDRCISRLRHVCGSSHDPASFDYDGGDLYRLRISLTCFGPSRRNHTIFRMPLWAASARHWKNRRATFLAILQVCAVTIFGRYRKQLQTDSLPKIAVPLLDC